jgi:Ca-activated chloride channel family protein
MLEFGLPAAFLLLPLPLLVFWLAPDFRDRGESVRAPFFSRLVALSGRTPREGDVIVLKRTLQRFVVVSAWLLVVTALADPRWLGEPVTRETAARDLLLLVDLSGSMEARDFQAGSEDGAGGSERISRLDAVKGVLNEFIARRQGDRVGLAVFGNAAFPQAPFTEDHDLVITLLDELQPRMAGPRTMMGDALGLAIRLFEQSETENRVAILLTDGNDTGSDMPVARAARIAADNGITVHTIAMGDPTTVGEEALDLPVLEEISAITGGRFFLALDSRQLDEVYGELDRIEPALVETVSYRPARTLFHLPLAVMVVLMAGLSLVMLLRGRSGRDTDIAGSARDA